MTTLNRSALSALMLLLPTAAPAAQTCAPRPTVTVAIAPFDLAYPPEKPERLYPQAARQAAISGHVTLECDAVSGRLDQCAIDEETPSDQGFGASALKVAKTLEVRTGPVPQIVRVEMQYDVLQPDGTCKGRS